MTPSIFISAGEASGEFYGAQLAAALSRNSAPKAKTTELWGMGGARMAAAGVECVVRAEDVAVMGFTEVVLHLPRIYREFHKLKRAIRARRPAVAVLIDFPEIHFPSSTSSARSYGPGSSTASAWCVSTSSACW